MRRRRRVFGGSNRVQDQRLLKEELFCDHRGWVYHHDERSLKTALPKAAGKQEKEPELYQEGSYPDLVGGQRFPQGQAQGKSGEAG